MEAWGLRMPCLARLGLLEVAQGEPEEKQQQQQRLDDIARLGGSRQGGMRPLRAAGELRI